MLTLNVNIQNTTPGVQYSHVTDASLIGVKPGQWPTVIVLVALDTDLDAYTVSRMVRCEPDLDLGGEVAGMVYRGEHGRSLLVIND